MTGERSRAYGRTVKTLRDLGPSKLHPGEERRVREAADALFFSHDPVTDEVARAAMDDVAALARHLLESGRWDERAADRLVAEVEACGGSSMLTAGRA